MRGVFITGTDTSIGKTVISASIVQAFSPNSSYWKPIQTGWPDDDDLDFIRTMTALDPSRCIPNTYRLKEPASPHYAARQEGTDISIENVLNAQTSLPKDSFYIIEGAGGLLVPLNEKELMVDLMARLKLPVVLVSSTGLGTINHTLLSLFYLEKRSIPTLGIITIGPPDPSMLSALAEHSTVPILAEIPQVTHVNQKEILSFAKNLQASKLAEMIPQ